MKKRTTSLRSLFLRDINPVIRFMILSDTIILGAGGLLGPIFALFIEDFIIGSNEAVVGIAAGIYLISRSLLQIPLAHLMDRIRGERDDYWLMVIFSVVMALVPLLYLVIDTPGQLYAVQFVLGIATAVTFPGYMAIFTRHIDRNKEGTEWGIYFTLTDASSAILAIVGGYLAASMGFPTLIVLVVAISLAGALFLLPVRPYIRIR